MPVATFRHKEAVRREEGRDGRGYGSESWLDMFSRQQRERQQLA